MRTRRLNTFRPQVRSDLDVVTVDSELVVWDGVNDRVHRIDRVGSLLWPFLDGTCEIEDLATDVAEVFELDLETARKSLEVLLHQLEDARLLEYPANPVRGPSPTH